MNNRIIKLLCSIFLIVLGLIILNNKLENQKKFNILEGKYFITIFNIMKENARITIFNGENKIFEFNAEYATSILSIEDNRIIYLENPIDKEKIKKNYIVEYDIKDKKIIKRTPLPFNYEKNVPSMLKKDSYIFFSSSDDWLHESYVDEETKIYEYNLATGETEEVLTCDGQGLPVIRKNEIIYSRENRIYIFDQLKNESKYLFDGELPFDYVGDKIYYVKDGKIMENQNGNEKIKYKFKGKVNIGGYPVRINDDLFLIIELKWMEDKFNTDYGKLKLIDAKNNKEIDLYKLYYEKNEKYPFLKNDMFRLEDKGLLEKYVGNLRE